MKHVHGGMILAGALVCGLVVASAVSDYVRIDVPQERAGLSADSPLPRLTSARPPQPGVPTLAPPQQVPTTDPGPRLERQPRGQVICVQVEVAPP